MDPFTIIAAIEALTTTATAIHGIYRFIQDSKVVNERLKGLGDDISLFHGACNAVIEELRSAERLPNDFNLGQPGQLLREQIDRCKNTIAALDNICKSVSQISGMLQDQRRQLDLMWKGDELERLQDQVDNHKQNLQLFLLLLNTRISLFQVTRLIDRLDSRGMGVDAGDRTAIVRARTVLQDGTMSSDGIARPMQPRNKSPTPYGHHSKSLLERRNSSRRRAHTQNGGTPPAPSERIVASSSRISDQLKDIEDDYRAEMPPQRRNYALPRHATRSPVYQPNYLNAVNPTTNVYGQYRRSPGVSPSRVAITNVLQERYMPGVGWVTTHRSTVIEQK